MPIFFILDAILESKLAFKGFMVYRIQKRLFICLHHSQSQIIPSNAIAKAASAAAWRLFPWGGPRRRGLWRPWPGEEPPCTAPAGWGTACWPGPGCPPILPVQQPSAAVAAVFLSDVSFSYTNLLSAVWFG